MANWLFVSLCLTKQNDRFLCPFLFVIRYPLWFHFSLDLTIQIWIFARLSSYPNITSYLLWLPVWTFGQFLKSNLQTLKVHHLILHTIQFASRTKCYHLFFYFSHLLTSLILNTIVWNNIAFYQIVLAITGIHFAYIKSDAYPKRITTSFNLLNSGLRNVTFLRDFLCRFYCDHWTLIPRMSLR